MRDAKLLDRVLERRAAEQVATVRRSEIGPLEAAKRPDVPRKRVAPPKVPPPSGPLKGTTSRGRKMAGLSLYLEPEDLRRLSGLRVRTGINASAHVREAVLQYLAHSERQLKGLETTP